jgi:hypothetical protein
MDPQRFDSLVQALGAAASRRRAIAMVLGTVLGGAGNVAAKSKGHGHAHHKQGKQHDKGKQHANGKHDGQKDRSKQRGSSHAPAPGNDLSAQATTCTKPGPGKNLDGCDYSGQDLAGKNLNSSSLRGTLFIKTILRGANLGAVNAKGASFRTANLCGAKLASSTLTNADFRGANLTQADLHASGCTGADFTGATFCQTKKCSGGIDNSGCPSGGATVCCASGDCPDRPCQTKRCQGNACVYTPVADGTTCDDGDPCTEKDTCNNGSCVGQTKDCSGKSDACNDGACRASDGACVARPKKDGTACSDNDSCTTGDSCKNGVCTPGTGVDCSAKDDECNTGVCQHSDGTCVKKPKDDGTPCGNGKVCKQGVCKSTCDALQDACSPNDNTCCQDTPTTCAVLNPNCYTTGAPQDPRCCHATRGTCTDACDCCSGSSGSLCEDGKCCNFQGGTCSSKNDCCNEGLAFDNRGCLNGKCCVTDTCDPNDDHCCTGTCGDDGVCRGCLNLGQTCNPSNNQCCQSGEPTDCDEAFPQSPNSICCRPLGGACSGNGDCCNGVACNGGRCCQSEEHATCTANSDCCPGMECRGGVCRTNICLEPGESCPPGAKACCATGGASCQGGRCCQQLGSQCERIPATGDPCCGEDTTCDETVGKCCYPDFQNLLGGPDCSSNDQCCSGYCHTPFRQTCCRPQGAACDSLGPLNFDCCPYLGLTCNGTTCVPCRKVGETCTGSGSSSTCCIGASCDNGVCTRTQCGEGGAPCQESSVCCPGFDCTSGGVCILVCAAEGESCAFGCCNGLVCDNNSFTCKKP